MFENPSVLPVILGIIALGVFYLIVIDRNAPSNDENESENKVRDWQVQCPNCQRWKKMPPIRREKLLNEQEARQRRLLSGPRARFLHEYKCQFCGHIWQENYSE